MYYCGVLGGIGCVGCLGVFGGADDFEDLVVDELVLV